MSQSQRVSLAVRGRFDEAITQFRQTLKLNPDDADAHNGLAWLLTNQRRIWIEQSNQFDARATSCKRSGSDTGASAQGGPPAVPSPPNNRW
jgi:hypothetical protein